MSGLRWTILAVAAWFSGLGFGFIAAEWYGLSILASLVSVTLSLVSLLTLGVRR